MADDDLVNNRSCNSCYVDNYFCNFYLAYEACSLGNNDGETDNRMVMNILSISSLGDKKAKPKKVFTLPLIMKSAQYCRAAAWSYSTLKIVGERNQTYS